MRYIALGALMIVSAPAAAQSASHLAAAHEIIALSHLAEQNRESDSAYVAWLLTRNPQLRDYEKDVRAYADAVYDWSVIERALAQSLTELLPEPELREVAQFLRSPAGRKWAATGIERRRVYATVVNERIDSGRGDFERRLQVRAQALGRPAPKVGQLVPSPD